MALSRKLLYGLGLLLFGSSFALVSPALVHAVSIQENINTSQTTQTDGDGATETSTSSRDQVNTQVVETTVQSIRQKAQKRVTEERKNRVKIDDNTREQLCQYRKNAIENKVAAFSSAANAHLDRLDGVYSKLDTYLAAHPVSGVDLAAAKTAQTTAAEKVTALQTVVGDGTVDCSNLTDNAAWLTQVRAAASEARDALKAYRAELKKVVVAVQQTPEKSSKDSSPTTDSDTTTTTTDGQ